MWVLTVVRDFGDFRRGDQITDPQLIAQILQSPNAANVVKTIAPNPQPTN